MDFLTFVSEQWILVSVLLVLLYLFAMNEGRRGGQNLSVHEFTRLVNDGAAVIVDVREQKEYREGHIIEAINIPYGKISERKGELEKRKDKTIILVDKMGQHSGNAGKILSKDGFKVARLRGGMTEWSGQNLPLVKG